MKLIYSLSVLFILSHHLSFCCMVFSNVTLIDIPKREHKKKMMNGVEVKSAELEYMTLFFFDVAIEQILVVGDVHYVSQ